MASKKSNPKEHDGASPGKIFIGGLAKNTTMDTFLKHFGKYGEIIDSVIMKDRMSGQPRGFGFITYSDPSVVDQVIEESHTINGKTVEIKRTIPKGSVESKDFKTKKVFVGGIPTTVSEDEFKEFFGKHGKVVEHQIIRDHSTNRSRGFGFIVFDNEKVVDELLSKGNMIDMAGTKVEVKKAEPKKSSNPPPATFGGGGAEPRSRYFGEDLGGFGNPYGSFGSGGGYGSLPYRGGGGSFGGRFGDYGGYGAGEFGSRYGSFGSGSLGAGGSYRGESPPLGGYSGRLGSSYSGSFGRGLGGGYGRDEEFGGYGGSSYESGPGAGYGGGPGPLYGSRGGYGAGAGGGGASRYNPYAR